MKNVDEGLDLLRPESSLRQNLNLGEIWRILKTQVKYSPMSWDRTKPSKLKSQGNLDGVGQLHSIDPEFCLSEVKSLVNIVSLPCNLDYQ